MAEDWLWFPPVILYGKRRKAAWCILVGKQDLELRGHRTQEAWPVAHLRGRTEVFIVPGRGSVVSRGFC